MNSSSNNGQSTSRALLRASKTSPCPHCGKPDWCYFIGELSVCNRDQPPATGWEATSKADKDGKIYYAPIQQKKSIRPRKTRYWEYFTRDGLPLVRVVRFDNGEGKTDWAQESWGKCKASRQIGWVAGTKGVARENIPIYRYTDVQKAIANNELIFIVEGESCADVLWDLGLAATCNIGGSGKWRATDTSDLEGANVVICPDRDKPGIKHAELLHQEFPGALWLYPFPESKAWENLPESKGLDIADWVEHHKITADDIKAAIGDKKTFDTLRQTQKIVTHPKFEAPNLSDLATKIDELLELDLRKSQLQIKISELAQTYRLTPAEIWKIYRTREQELEQESDQEDTAAEVARLLASKATNVNLFEILPQPLAEAIVRLATTLNLKPEGYTLALFTQVSTLLKASTTTMLYPQTNFRVCPNYFGALVSESSQKKTPVIRAVIIDPMEALKVVSDQEFEKASLAYEEDLNHWKADKEPDKGPMPKPPAQKIYHFTTATGEGIAAQVGRLPQQSLLWVADELAGAFKSANQYRGGKGSDEENLLEYWSGGGSAVLRAAGLAVNARNVGLSIFGNIQPKVLATFLGEGNDDNGKFARFDFVQQPLAATELFEDAPSVDLTPMLTSLYARLDTLPPQKFELDKAARKLFIAYYNQCERDRIASSKQGMRSMFGKAPEKVGKLATILHCIHGAFQSVEISSAISAETIRAAIKFVKYTTDQALSLNLEICDSTALAPSLAKIISLAERKGGRVSARDVSLSFDSKHRPTGQQIRDWLRELVVLKYGEVTSKGQKITFTLTPHSTVSTLDSNQDIVSAQVIYSNKLPYPHLSTLNDKSVDKCGYTVDNPIHTFKPLPDETLELSVDTVDTKTPSSKNSKSLMMSCTTEIEVSTATTTKNLRTFEKGDRVVIKDVGGMFQGVRGEISDVWHGRAGETYIVRFDKPVRNIRQTECEGSNLMKL
ncbi:DUF3987 domain-containing protein [Tychonema sp. LEGE 07199]|uniref:DUF3987 domain-containing protein n=1 Tax=unclassified Tychonema TaxID=2642144 RepID=UPI00187F50F2|nr:MULTISPECIES: DUF3987 domain-containing protein [unclassified Tychonema]MBE9119325.1 DUF3987 domain-containing protein [Tychonema sp. LEGE 07199]MBE9130588.1 DUF3987 domain-containing protein [Tychonema sp. LEGE 07196]